MTKRRKVDRTIHGKVVTTFDPKFDSVDVSKDWKGVTQEINGENWVKLEDVKDLFCENEILRETLFISHAQADELPILALKQFMGHSTSNVLNQVKHIEALSNNVLTSKEIFTFVYDIMATDLYIDFKNCPKNSSKLQWLWTEGYLPIVSLLISLLLRTLRYLRGTAPKELRLLAKKIKANQAVKVKPQKTSPF